MVEARRKAKPGFLLWLSLALPILVYVGAIGLAEAKRFGAPQIELKIEGYDPRDLLRGQYLQYRIATEERDGASRYKSQACAGSPAPRLSQVYVYDEGQRSADCRWELPVDFVFDVHRYYIQQDRGRELEEAVRDGRASVRVRVVSRQTALVEDLLIDGKPLN